QREFAVIIQHSADALLTVINDILDFSKIEAGKMAIEVVGFNLRTAIEEVVDLLAPRAHEKGLEVVCAIPPVFPELLIGDPGRVRQVLTNLLGNAVKFTVGGEIVIGAEVLDTTPTHARLRLSVRDTGIGIPAERHHSVFE